MNNKKIIIKPLNIIIIGVGGLARELVDYINKDNFYGFLADSIPEDKFFKERYLGKLNKINNYKNFKFVLGIANKESKNTVLNFIKKNKIKVNFTNLIHESSFVSKDIKLGKGNIIAPNSHISYGCNIGNFNVINYGTFLGHDTKIGHHNHFAPKCTVLGNCKISNSNYVGANSVVESEIKVGSNNSTLSGSRCLNNIKNNSLVFNSPGRVIINKTK